MFGNIVKYSSGYQTSPEFGRIALLVFFLAVILVSGCTGVQTFSLTAYPGDTIGMAIGRQDIKLKDATIVITDSNGSQSFPANGPLVRAWFNVYPDPVSRLVVGRETGQNLNTEAWVWGTASETTTGINERDLYDTIVMIDLPTNLVGTSAEIDIQDPMSNSILAGPVTVNLLSGTGMAHTFDIWEGGGSVDSDALGAMRRSGKTYTVRFTGGTEVPEAIQVDFIHDPDRENSGAGQAYVVSPRGDICNTTWTDWVDNGVSRLRVILTKAWQKSAEDLAVAPDWDNEPDLSWFKFYVAGDITGLQVDSVSAFDVDGQPVNGITVDCPACSI